jgi:hypothetical protein
MVLVKTNGSGLLGRLARTYTWDTSDGSLATQVTIDGPLKSAHDAEQIPRARMIGCSLNIIPTVSNMQNQGSLYVACNYEAVGDIITDGILPSDLA